MRKGHILSAILSTSALFILLAPAKSQRRAARAPHPQPIDAQLRLAIKAAPPASRWPNSDFVRLLDIGTVDVSDSGLALQETRIAYKLFNERARRLAEVEIRYNSASEAVSNIHARTILKSGKIVEVKPEDMRVTAPFGAYPLYGDMEAIGFSMPAIEDDCVIDYGYTKLSLQTLMPGQFWQFWRFSSSYPVALSRLTLTLPASKPLRVKKYNAAGVREQVTTSKNGRSKTYTWEIRDADPILEEPDMPNRFELVAWMELSTLGSWDDVARWYWNRAKPRTESGAAVKATVDKLIGGKSSQADKAKAIYDWVATKIRDVPIELGASGYRPNWATHVHRNLYGDPKDKAGLLIGMLRYAGINAYPALLRPGDKRPLRDQLPYLQTLRHCMAVAEVDNQLVWLDPIEGVAVYGDIPAADRGSEAFVIRDGKGNFMTVPPFTADDNGGDVKLEAALREDGGATIRADMPLRGTYGQIIRGAVRLADTRRLKEAMEQTATRISPGARLISHSFKESSERLGDLSACLVLEAPNLARKTAERMIFPAALGSSVSGVSNPYVSDKRVHPIVNEETMRFTFRAVVHLPAGYEVDDLPAVMIHSGPILEIDRRAEQSPDGRQVTVAFRFTVKRCRLPASQYHAVRADFDKLFEFVSDQIVLKRSPSRLMP